MKYLILVTLATFLMVLPASLISLKAWADDPETENPTFTQPSIFDDESKPAPKPASPPSAIDKKVDSPAPASVSTESEEAGKPAPAEPGPSKEDFE